MSHEIIGPSKLQIKGKDKDKSLNRKKKDETRSFLENIGDIENIYWDESFGKAILETNRLGRFKKRRKDIFEKTGWKIEIRRPTSSGMVEKTRNLIYQSDGRYRFLKKIGRSIKGNDTETEWIRLSFLGGCREVGRNSILLQTNNSKVLLDHGISMDSGEPPLNAPELDLKELDSVLLSHSHLDHSGKIASLYENGYRGPLFATEPTLTLTRLLKKDAYKISKSRTKEEAVGYSPANIDEMLKHSIPLNYREKVEVAPDIAAKFFDAGHLPGSAGIYLEIDNDYNLFYTGDFDIRNSKLLQPADFDFDDLNTLVMESTYAYEEIPSRSEVEKDLVKIVRNTLDRNGTPIISTFAIGRSQEILSILNEYDVEANVFVDGMIREATKIISSYPSYLKTNLNQKINFVYGEKDRIKAVRNSNTVILTTSGMLTGGAVQYYLEKLQKDKNSSLILPGYLAEGTPGRKIQNGDKKIEISGNEYDLELETYILRFSGHPDHSDLWNFLHEVGGKPNSFIIHGEGSGAKDFSDSIERKLGWDSFCPKNLDSFRLR